MNKQRISRVLSFVFLISIFSVAHADMRTDRWALELQDELNGGNDRPVNLMVRQYKDALILEGSVDKILEREVAVQTCHLHTRHQGLYKKKGFKSPDEMCVNRIRLRPGAPAEPPNSVRIEYKLVFMPDTSASADSLMMLDYEKLNETNQKSIQLSSAAIQLNDDGDAGSAYSYRMPASLASDNSATLNTKEATETQEVINLDLAAKSILDTSKKYVFNTKSQAFSFDGTDRLSLTTELSLNEVNNSDSIIKLKTVVTLLGGQLTPIGVITNLKNKDVPAIVVLARATKFRRAP